MVDAKDLKLCYVESRLAWFTTAPLEEQWGDDWDDAPYEHNASEPYKEEEYELMVGMFTGQLEDPATYANASNTSWSVLAINAGAVPWLKSSPYSGKPAVKIYAGEGPVEVARKIHQAGGTLWTPLRGPVTRPELSWLQQPAGMSE